MRDDHQDRENLLAMKRQIVAMLAEVDEAEDHLLGALLCDTLNHLTRRLDALPRG